MGSMSTGLGFMSHVSKSSFKNFELWRKDLWNLSVDTVLLHVPSLDGNKIIRRVGWKG